MGSMKAAAIGVSVHSGWGAVVAIAGGQGVEEILLRRRVVIIDSQSAGSVQPYHYVVKRRFVRLKPIWLDAPPSPDFLLLKRLLNWRLSCKIGVFCSSQRPSF